MVDTYIKDAPSNWTKDQPITFLGVGQIAFFEALVSASRCDSLTLMIQTWVDK